MGMIRAILILAFAAALMSPLFVMARMIPDMTVEEVEREHGSHAEARMYAAARDQLGADYTVLYSGVDREDPRSWAPGGRGRLRDPSPGSRAAGP